MSFQNYTSNNNCRSQLVGGISAGSTSMIITSGEGAIRPSTYPYLQTIESYTNSIVTKREIVKVTNRSSDTFTIVRSAGYCVQDDSVTPKVRNNTARAFSDGDYVSLYITAEQEKDVQDEIYNNDNTSNLVHKTGTETITGDKTHNGLNTFGQFPITPSSAPTTNYQVPNKKYVDDQTSSLGAGSVFITGVAGEDLTAGNLVFTEGYPTFAQATGITAIGQDDSNVRVYIKAIGTGTAATTINLSLKKFSSPTQNLNGRVETDSAGSPSGSLAHANATFTIAAGSLTTSLADTALSFAGSVTFTAGQKLHIVLFMGSAYGNEITSYVNYYGVGASANNTTTRNGGQYNGTNYSNPTPKYDISTVTYDSKYVSIAGQDISGISIQMKADGTVFWMEGVSTNKVYQYTVGTPGDITTATYAAKSFNFASQDSAAQGLFIRADGVKMYMAGNANVTIYQYTLSSPYDVSTASYDSKSFSVAAQFVGAVLMGVDFKSDGTKMWISTTAGTKTIFQYTLGTPWDVTTASYDTKSLNVSAQNSDPRGLQISPNGKRVYSNSASAIFQYTMSTPYDISTATYDTKTVTTSGQDSSAYGFTLANSGQKLFLVGSTGDVVLQYSVGATTFTGFPYVSSTSIQNKVFSKTDSTYLYKSTIAGEANASVSLGQTVRVNQIYGTNQTSLTPGSYYFLTNTPGTISTTPGTIKTQVGLSDTSTSIVISPSILYGTSISPGVSPYIYQNTTGKTIKVTITAGTVSAIDYSRDGSNYYTRAAATNNDVFLAPGDYVKTTYSSVPTMNYFYF